MTDKEILEEVWQKLRRMEHPLIVAQWIEQEWQRADDLDVKEIEKKNGLELDENGTTKE